MSRIEQALEKLGLSLPSPAAPAAAYVPFTKLDLGHSHLVFISGQVPLGPKGLEYRGKAGLDFDVAQASLAARLCALNVLAQLKAACAGDLDRAQKCLRLGGFINAVPDFEDHSKVVNGASELILNVMGDDGRHARTSVGVVSLPFNVAVEIEATFEIS